MKTRMHMLKCLAFFIYHLFDVDSSQYKGLLQVSHTLNMIQEKRSSSDKPTDPFIQQIQLTFSSSFRKSKQNVKMNIEQ